MRYCKNLRFAQVPDYSYLRSLFRGCLKRNNLNEDYIFDWHEKIRSKSKLSLFSASSSPASKKGTLEKIEPVEVKKLLDVENEHNRRLKERRCSKSLPNSLYNSLKDETEANSVSVIEKEVENKVEVKNVAEKQSPRRVIPVLKISPAKENTSQSMLSPREVEKAEKSSNSSSKNQLNVPNGTPKARKLRNQTESDQFGTMTLKVNPMYKRSASEVAKRSNIVTCTTCFPLFHRLLRQS